MKRAIRIILILLPVALLVGCLMHPLVRFGVDLYLGRSEQAASVYLSGIKGSPRLDGAARQLMQGYAQKQAAAYDSRRIPYDRAVSLLFPLSGAELFEEDVGPYMEAIENMEAARKALTAADACAAGGDYARAIPLYRQALIADEGAAYRLSQAESAYKNEILERADAAMASGELTTAEAALVEGQTLLGTDEDLLRALADVYKLQADAAFAAREQEALRLLREEGAEAAFSYADELRRQDPDDYGYEYIQQLVRHAFEDDVCARALALGETDPAAALALLDEGSTWLDSERMRFLYGEIRSTIPFWLVDMPLLRDETADPRTGADSTVARNETLYDALSNEYTNSFWADLGNLSFSLGGGFDSFTGTVAFPQGETADIYRAAATLQVFGDGRLIAEFKDMDGSSAPVPFSIPVAGVDELTLRWTSEGANGWRDWGRFATVFDGRLLPVGQ